MSVRAIYPPGQPGWVAHLGPDADQATRFYGPLFGWDFENIASHGAPPFYIATSHGDPVASLTGPEQPAVWIIAITVADLDAAIRAVTSAGGRSPGESVDIATLGRFHRLEDPSGAEVHIVEPPPDPPRHASPNQERGRRAG